MRRLFPLVVVLSGGALAADDCKCMPGDACWPSAAEWNQFNSTVDGRLIATVPLGQVCHDPAYNEALCNFVKLGWNDVALQ
jgi:hypothetical protein